MSSREQQTQEKFFHSVVSEDIDGVRKAVHDGADVNVGSDLNQGMCALHMAALKGDTAMIECLLDLGAGINISAPENKQYSPLMFATEYGNIEAMKLLIKRGAYVYQLAENGKTLCGVATGARGNVEAVWEVLMAPESGLVEPTQLPNDPGEGPHLIESAIDNLYEKMANCDAKGLGTLIRLGADWSDCGEGAKQPLLHSLIWLAAERSAQNRGISAHIAETIKHVLDAGVSPYLVNQGGLYAYDNARQCAAEAPEVLQAFREKGQEEARGLTQLKLTLDKLVDSAGEPTNLVKYCCSEGRLGELLAAPRWPNPAHLISAKRALAEALPPYYQNIFSAELDITANVRAVAAEGALARFRPHSHPAQRG